MKAGLAGNKATIIAIIALVIVCTGSFLGVKYLNNKQEVPTTSVIATQSTLSTTTSTTTQTTNSTTATTESTTATTSQSASNVITTFALPTTPTTGTTRPSTTVTTTAPTTTTTLPTTTQPLITTTRPTTTIPTTQKAETPNQVIHNAALFDEGFMSYMFNPDGDFYYTNTDPWQRAFGYNEFYDMGAPFVGMYIDTMRCKFQYANKDWMIQFWKGQYGYVFVGHEIGVYTKPLDRETEHYDAANDEDALYMSMTGYRDGEELYTRDYGKYWWCTGFVPGVLDSFADRSEMGLKCRITMKDYKMLLAFSGALKENNMVLGEDFTTKGLDVYITW